MRWRRGVGADQIEDRRGMGPMSMAGGGLGIVGLILALLFGGDVLGGGGGTGLGGPAGAPDPDDDVAQFVGFVVDNVQGFWSQEFAATGQAYEPTTLVLFDSATSSGCGPASASTGPFYCTLDRKVYLDLGFFRALRDRFGAPGDFAQAYVIAHEFGHHVQTVLGAGDAATRARQRAPDNEVSVRFELQADCLAGVWASAAYREDLLESGDLEEGLAAAEAVGDDRIQAASGGGVNPETWTHGSSQQRMDSFLKGYRQGGLRACQAFGGAL